MRTAKLIVCTILVLTLSIFSFAPFSQALTLKAHATAQQKLQLHAFYPAQMTFSEQTKKYIDSLDSISFAWGRLYADLEQGVNTQLNKNDNTMFYYPEDYVEVLKYAKSKNKTKQLSIFTDSVNAAEILPYKERREKAVRAISVLLKTDVSNGEQLYFDGVVIDFEALQNKDIKGKVVYFNGKPISDWFTQFLKELKAELKTINKTMFVAVNPLLNYTGYDYGEISSVADKMIVMAHDYEPIGKLTKSDVKQYTGYNTLVPVDSMAPYKKVKLALEDVKKNVSKANLRKVLLQITFDSAQWRFAVPQGSHWDKVSGAAISLEKKNTPTYDMIYSRVQNADKKASGMSYGFNNELRTPFIQYFNIADQTQNIILYENSTSVKAKLSLAKEYGIGGVSLWSLANVPDYNDRTSKAYGLDVWNTISGSLAVTTNAAFGTRVVFSDKVVEAAVRKQLMKPTGHIYSNELSGVYRLSIPYGVKTLVDLKKLTNLEYLNLSNAGIGNISNLSNLKNLRVLYLQRNNIGDITVLKGLTKLEVLSLNGNNITNIKSLSALSQLSELYIRDNKIADFTPIANLKRLNILYLNGNKSVDYSKLNSVKQGLQEKDF